MSAARSADAAARHGRPSNLALNTNCCCHPHSRLCTRLALEEEEDWRRKKDTRHKKFWASRRTPLWAPARPNLLYLSMATWLALHQHKHGAVYGFYTRAGAHTRCTPPRSAACPRAACARPRHAQLRPARNRLTHTRAHGCCTRAIRSASRTTRRTRAAQQTERTHTLHTHAQTHLSPPRSDPTRPPHAHTRTAPDPSEPWLFSQHFTS